jgi:hypothetical protein
MRNSMQMRETIGELAQATLLGLIGVLAIVTVSFGKKPTLQTDSQPVSLFKVPYGEEPTRLRMRFTGILPTEGEEKPLFGGGPISFCVSWDGQLFYIADPLRCYDKNLEPPPEEEGEEISPQEEELMPWVQVYNRQGQWVRTIKLKYGYPSRIRVDERGWLYVDDAKHGVAIYRPDGSYDQQRTEAIAAAVQRAAMEHHLDLDFTEFFEVDRGGRVYFLASKIVDQGQDGTPLTLRECLLVVHPDGRTDLHDYNTYRQYGIDRYRGEIIIGDYDTPAEGRIDVQFVIHSFRPDNEEDDRDTIAVFKKEPYQCVRPDGGVVRKFDWYLDISDRVPNVWDGFIRSMNWVNQMAIATDEAGHLYRVYIAQHRHWIRLGDPDDPHRSMQLMDGFWIIEFSPEGRFIRSRASNLRLKASYGHQEDLVGPIVNLWDVDKHGNVYWMEFHPRYVEIKMSPR